MTRSLILAAAVAAMVAFWAADTVVAQGRGGGGQGWGQQGAGGMGWRGGRGQRGGRGMGQGRGRHAGQEDNRGDSQTESTALNEAAEKELVYMREEEKLAHDVYVALGDKWNVSVFTNISSAESRHMRALEMTLERYGIDDPVTDPTAGVFQNSTLQKLYSDLVTQGSESLTDAYKVGALIEELDISDLRKAKELTEQQDINRVYDNLERASRNHLRAFAAQLAESNETYEAKHLTQKEFDRIADGQWETGGPSGAMGSGRGQGRGKNDRGDSSRGGRGHRRGMGRGQGHTH